MKFMISVFPGLSGLLGEELWSRIHLKSVAGARVRGSELVWVQTSDPAGLLELRLAEDVFVSMEALKLTGKKPDLKAVTAAVASPEALAAAVRAYGHITGRVLPARAQYRVVVQADDAVWRDYRRVDLQAAAEAGLRRVRPGWRLSPDEAPLELWLHQAGRTLHVSLRLTNGLQRSRGGRQVERAAALRPTIAAAMVLVSLPADDDVFLDPMCGSGTILLERAMAARHGLLLGGDIDLSAVKAAVANFGSRHKPVRVERMDARKLPLENNSVDKFVTNLPWGVQVGKAADLPTLYVGVLGEAVRVVRPGGLVVLLTSERAVLSKVIQALPKLKFVRKVQNIEVLGRPAELVVLERT